MNSVDQKRYLCDTQLRPTLLTQTGYFC
uniref:Uncharacterized protein n=1 Tax=Arundo donax TaxID=35708 RepID=A0A0A9BSV7_ARUDO